MPNGKGRKPEGESGGGGSSEPTPTQQMFNTGVVP